jgi:hypothetical protein
MVKFYYTYPLRTLINKIGIETSDRGRKLGGMFLYFASNPGNRGSVGCRAGGGIL